MDDAFCVVPTLATKKLSHDDPDHNQAGTSLTFSHQFFGVFDGYARLHMSIPVSTSSMSITDVWCACSLYMTH